MKVVGYSDTLSLQPDKTIQFMVSCDLPKYRMDIVRLIHGGTNSEGLGFKEQEINANINGYYRGRRYSIDSGLTYWFRNIPF
jgi:N,N-dimethylformamidase